MDRSALVTIEPGCPEDDVVVILLAWVQGICWRVFTEAMIRAEERKMARMGEWR